MRSRLSDKFDLEQPARLPDQVAEILSKEIDKGTLRPGEKLPSEADLSRRFGVSRSVIREALSQLRYEGLLESHQGKGIIVVGAAGRRSFRLETAEKLSHEDLAQLYELRAILESEAAALAATRGTEKDLDRLRIGLEGMAQAVLKDTDGTNADLDFHRTVAEAGGNRHLQDLMHYLNDKVAGVIHEARKHSRLRAGFPEEVQREHEAIYEAIAAGDPDRARETVLEHLTKAAKRLGLRILSRKSNPESS